nr:cell wall protein DAN4-like; partial [Biomphalaria glabrata]
MLPKDIYIVACLALVINTRFLGAIDLDFDPALRLPASRFFDTGITETPPATTSTAPATTSTPATTTTVDRTKYSKVTPPATTSTPPATTSTQKPASNITAHSILSLIFNTNVASTTQTPPTTTYKSTTTTSDLYPLQDKSDSLIELPKILRTILENAISGKNPTTTVAPSSVRATASPTTTPNTASTMTTTSAAPTTTTTTSTKPTTTTPNATSTMTTTNVAPTTTTRNATLTMTTTSAAPTTTTTSSTKPTTTTASTAPIMTTPIMTAPTTTKPSNTFIFPAPSVAPLMTTSRAPHITTPSAAHIMTTPRGANKRTTPRGALKMTTPSTSTGFEHIQQQTTTRPIKQYSFPNYYYHPNNNKVKVYGKGNPAETTSEEDKAPNNPLAVIYIYPNSNIKKLTERRGVLEEENNYISPKETDLDLVTLDEKYENANFLMTS